MANITKRPNKDGLPSYRIRVSDGYTAEGRQRFKTKTYTPGGDMTPRQIEKEVQRQATLFEERCKQGLVLDEGVKLSNFMERWFNDYAIPQLKPKTVVDYRLLSVRCSQAMGHLKLSKIQPHHLLEFYAMLQEETARGNVRYTALPALEKELDKRNKACFIKEAGIGEETLRGCLHGKNVRRDTAEKISNALSTPFSKLFKDAIGGDRTLSNETIGHYHRFLSTVFSTAVIWQIIPQNPCERVKPPKSDKKEAAFLDESTLPLFLHYLNDAPTDYRVACLVALYTGLRRGEICGLCWSDIDFEAETLAVNRNAVYIPKRGIETNSPKTKKSQRVLKVTCATIEALQEQKRAQLAERLRIGSKWNDTGFCFTTWNGNIMPPDTLSDWFHKFIDAHEDLPRITFHGLRHTNASFMISEHIPITAISGRLGHAQTSTTANIYGHCFRSADAAAADALENVFEKAKHSV